MVAICLTCLYLFLFLQDDCEGQSHYVIESRRSTVAPARYISLNMSDLQLYPLLKDVIDAFEDPDSLPGASLANGTLTYEVFVDRLEDRVTDTNDYLLERMTNEFGPPVDPPLHFSYVSEKDSDPYFYTWSVTVVDLPCSG